MEPQSPNQPQPPESASEPLPAPPGGWERMAGGSQSAPPAPPVGAAPPAAAGPPPGWGQPPAPPAAAGAAPSAWVQPQQGWVQPQAVATRGPVSLLSKIGSLFLMVMGVLISLGGLAIVAGGGVLTAIDDQSGFADAVGGAIAVFGVVIVVIGALQLLAGIGAWRGSGVGRVLGVIFGVLFGLIALGAGAARTTDATTGVSVGGGPVAIVIAAGYLYTAAVFIFVWRRRA